MSFRLAAGSLAAARKSGISSWVKQEWALALVLAVARVSEDASVEMDPSNNDFTVWASLLPHTDRTGLSSQERVEDESSNKPEMGRITFARRSDL